MKHICCICEKHIPHDEAIQIETHDAPHHIKVTKEYHYDCHKKACEEKTLAYLKETEAQAGGVSAGG